LNCRPLIIISAILYTECFYFGLNLQNAIKYNTLIANMLMVQNVIDITQIVRELKSEGWSIEKEDLGGLSPYLTAHFKRFGDFVLNLDQNAENTEKTRLDVLFT